MKIVSFKDIIAWQKARELTKMIYSIFQNNKDFSFRDQIQRAAISVMNNIAEGFERQSDKEFLYFLHIAKGSITEVRSMLVIGQDLGYISAMEFEEFEKLAIEITKLLHGFIKSIRSTNDS